MSYVRVEHVAETPPETATAEPPRSSAASWPEPTAEDAFYGLAGDFVRAADPHTEADRVAVLSQFLVFFGNAAGRARYFRVEGDQHTSNLNLVLVGDTSGGRKGTSASQVRRPFEAADPVWAEGRIQSGLSSGEGLIWAVRDQIMRRDPIKEHGRIVRYEAVEADPGVGDKRLLVLETEFSSTLKIAEREGNVLTGTVRQAWDSGTLRIMTKSSPAKSTGVHVSIVAHIPQVELLRTMSSTELGNGFANRFVWVSVRRSKLLPEGGCIPEAALAAIAARLRDALEFARHPGEVRRDENARKMWRTIYESLSSRKPGLLGAVLSRAEAQVTRMSLIYALLDRSDTIRPEHLAAAVALWEYSQASVRYIFGDSIGDPVADAILQALRSTIDGLNRTQISELFTRNQDKQRIDRALAELLKQDLARMVPQATDKGRPPERWLAVRLRQSGGAA